MTSLLSLELNDISLAPTDRKKPLYLHCLTCLGCRNNHRPRSQNTIRFDIQTLQELGFKTLPTSSHKANHQQLSLSLPNLPVMGIMLLLLSFTLSTSVSNGYGPLSGIFVSSFKLTISNGMGPGIACYWFECIGNGMLCVSSITEHMQNRVPKITEKLTWASSLIAIALGIAIIVSQFFGFSLY